MSLETEIATIAIALVGVVIAVAGYLGNREKIKESDRQFDRQFNLLSDGVRALTAIAESQRKQVEALAQQIQVAAVQKQQELILKQQEANWRILEGIGKAFGWAKDRGYL